MIDNIEAYRKITKVIYVNDGDNISVIVRTQPSVSDPLHQYKAIATVFRVVASGFPRPVLQLVPLDPTPVLLTEIREGE